jgi:glyoxylase-like metal-dependent hydrolase (beta-lactamase superfamily II)
VFGLDVESLPAVDRFYEPDTTLTFGRYDIDVLHTPGHCPGGVCLAIGRTGSTERELFVGDTLFAGSIGRTDLPGGDMATLLRSIRNVLFKFPDDAVVHSGHGPDTTIGPPFRFGAGQVGAGDQPDRLTVNSTRPTVSLSPSRNTDRSTFLPLTSVPFVLSRSSTTS